jgi:transglycosylase associated protein
MNITLGIIGAGLASWLFGFLGITFAGWIGYLIAGFIWACILIAIVRALTGVAANINHHRGYHEVRAHGLPHLRGHSSLARPARTPAAFALCET